MAPADQVTSLGAVLAGFRLSNQIVLGCPPFDVSILEIIVVPDLEPTPLLIRGDDDLLPVSRGTQAEATA